MTASATVLAGEDFQKRIRGQLAGKTIVDSRRGKLLHETGKLPRWYVPKEDVEPRALEPSERRKEHPSKGVATYYHVRAGDRSVLDAAWSYEQSPEGLPLAGLVAFEFDKLDGWLQEDDPVRGHPRDPYHRFDCNHTSELVVVHVGGQLSRRRGARSSSSRLAFRPGTTSRSPT